MTTEYIGRGDPARTLALLWRDPSRARERAPRKGRPELTADRVITAAIEVADAEGLAALSMRKVADHLGVGTMSLYTHVPGKAELIDVMLDTVYKETFADARVPDGWRARVERIARDNLALYRRHPWILQVAVSRPPLGPGTLGKYEHELSALDGIGLTDLEMDNVLTLVAAYVHGAARGVVEAARAAQETGMTDEEWWRAHEPFLAAAGDFSAYPLAARVGSASGEAYNAPADPAGSFEFGLARLLDGIAVLIEGR
uniref:TetR/AcrR family transcriptional regulator n=1 Tax=Herbidospora sakaeratensis TaxID=564415 RepID=UPI00078277D5|nr:TetR/AcrR family transcriptional regulator [Herbidospora sakaeratensis]